MMGYKLKFGAFGAGVSCVHNTAPTCTDGCSMCVKSR